MTSAPNPSERSAEPAQVQSAFDIVVIGSGAGGLTAAVNAARHGLSALLIEKAAVIGGTSALSGGTIWVPCNPLQQAHGVEDSPPKARTYLGAVIGDLIRSELVDAYIAHGGAMVSMLAEHSELRFSVATYVTDYKSELPGAVAFGRSITALPYDGKRLGAALARLRKPLAATTLIGGMNIDFPEIAYFLNMARSPNALRKVLAICLRYAWSRLRYGRDTRLTLGNALTGALFKSALDLGVTVWTSAAARELVTKDGGVRGVLVEREGRKLEVSAERGVVLASGGFASSESLKQRYFNPNFKHPSMSVASCEGDAMRMGLSAGGRVGGPLFQEFLGYPISIRRRADGSVEHYMHLAMQRSKPGTICVDEQGRRFMNEASPYNDFAFAFEHSGVKRAWLIDDLRHLRKYGFGVIRPGPAWLRPLKRFIDTGYVVCGQTIQDLARKLGMEPTVLQASVDRWNALSVAGRDDDFGRGDSRHDRGTGDPGHEPHPNLGSIEEPPFFAIEIHPGNLGSYVGLETDAQGRVVGQGGTPVDGLYACGLDAHSVFSGCYPGGGSSIGPSMVFGYIASEHIAGSKLRTDAGCSIPHDNGVMHEAVTRRNTA